MSFFKNKWFEYIYIAKDRWVIALVFSALIGSSILGFYAPILISRLYNSFISEESVWASMMALAILFVGELIINIFYQLGINLYIKDLIFEVRKKSYGHWLHAYDANESSYKYPMGEVIARLINDTDAFMELISSGAFRIFIDFSFIISCLISFMTINSQSGFFLLTAEILACIILLMGSKQLSFVFMEVRKATGALSKSMANIIGGLRTVFYTPNYKHSSQKIAGVSEDFLNKQLVANMWDASYYALAESLFPILLALLVVVFPYTQITEMAMLAAIIDLIQRSINPIKDVASKVSSIQRARTGFSRIVEFNTELKAELNSSSFFDIESLSIDKLIFKLPQFFYPLRKNQDVAFGLKNINFDVEKGQLVGIVGMSGCGKSTLLKILALETIANECEIILKTSDQDFIINFNQLDEKMINLYKKQVSIVTQDSHVFSETLKFNITFGEDLAHFEQFWSELANKIPYLAKWSMAPDTMINVKNISQGQKQLISALRACFLSKPIVLFDEISSALDSDLEEALRKLILMIQKKSITFIVAHRIETIISADKIILMDSGEVLKIGTHQELLMSQRIYQEFIEHMKNA